jgi:hypothetical protein
MSHWLENLCYSIEIFDQRGNLLEVLGRESDLDIARGAFAAYAGKYPDKLVLLCWKAQILKRSDQPNDANERTSNPAGVWPSSDDEGQSI